MTPTPNRPRGSRRTSALVAVLLAALSVECAKYVDDGATVCIVPPNCPCDAEPYDQQGCEASCPGGEFPADTSIRVIADLIDECSSSDYRLFECTVAQSGERELTIHTTWQQWDQNACLEGAIAGCLDSLVFNCEDIPPLAEGTWTIVYGATTRELTIPSSIPTSPPTSPPDPWNCFRADGS